MVHIDDPILADQYTYKSNDEVSGDISVNNSADVEYRAPTTYC